MSEEVRFHTSPIFKGAGYHAWMGRNDLGGVVRQESGRWKAVAFVDQHGISIPGFGTSKGGTMEQVQAKTADGFFPSRASAAKALVREFNKRGIRRD